MTGWAPQNDRVATRNDRVATRNDRVATRNDRFMAPLCKGSSAESGEGLKKGQSPFNKGDKVIEGKEKRA